MSWSYLHKAFRWALAVGFVFGASAIVQAEEKSEGKVVQIGRADQPERPVLPPVAEDEGEPSRPAPPKFWIGLLGGAIPTDHPLRSHVDLPEQQGLLVANVVPKSPADKAGLKQYDILLKGNGNDLHEMKDLIDLVMSEGAKKGEIKLDVLRRNKHETVVLKPEDRPADAEIQQSEGGGGGGGFAFGQTPTTPGSPFGGQPGMPRPNGPMQFNFRNFGPGVIVGGDPFAGLPNGVSISVQKQTGQPTHIVVQRGEDKWDITGDDPEALKKLPEDLRPTVERMLHGGGGMGGAMGGSGSVRLPNFPPPGPGMGLGPDGNRMLEQLQRMEKQLNEMQQRMNGRNNPPVEDSTEEQGESK